MDPTSIWSALVAEVREDGTPIVALGLLVTLGLMRWAVADEHQHRVRAMSLFTALHGVVAVAAGCLRPGNSTVYLDLHVAAIAFAAVAGVGMASALLFNVGLPRVRLRPPHILQDVLVAGGSVAAVFIVASRNGFNLSGLIATSAVLTAVIGFSLQETLGNIAGGLSLQLDNSIGVGDWVK